MFQKVSRLIFKIKWFFANVSKINQQSFIVNSNTSYNADGLIVFNNSDCLQEEKFLKAYNDSLTVNDWRGKDGSKFDMRWRYYIVCYFANYAKQLEGDFVECGVYKGGYAMAIFSYLNPLPVEKKFWLLDTYEGLVLDHLTEKEKEDQLHIKYAHYENTYDSVSQMFKNMPAKIIKGAVPGTLPECTAEKVCYLSIDMNCVEPEIAAADFFWDKMVPGGVIILDDYGFKEHIEQKKAFDIFASQKKVPILQLPTGQAIIFKN